MSIMDGNKKQAIRFLVSGGIHERIAGRILEIAREHGHKAHPVKAGILDVRYSRTGIYTVSFPDPENIPASKRPPIAPVGSDRYTHSPIAKKNNRQEIQEDKMAPRKAQATAPPAETEETAKDYTEYATKPLTPTMQDFAEWLEANVGDLGKMEADRLVALGPTLYHDFQASDFNRERKAERRAAKETESMAEKPSAAAKEEAKAPAKAPRGRAASKAPATAGTAPRWARAQ